MSTDTTDTTTAVKDLSERWTRAELAGDVPAIASLLHEDFLAVGPRGFLLTKEQWLDRHRSGDLVYQSLTWEDASVREFGDTAVSVAVQDQKATFQGRDIPGTFRVTVIVTRGASGWAIAGAHLSMMGMPPGGPGQGGPAAPPAS